MWIEFCKGAGKVVYIYQFLPQKNIASLKKVGGDAIAVLYVCMCGIQSVFQDQGQAPAKIGSLKGQPRASPK